MSWTGTKFYCIRCGSHLEEEPLPNEPFYKWDFDNEQEFQSYLSSEDYRYSTWYHHNFGESNTYHCTNNECPCKEYNSIVLFHPIGNIGTRAGESLAFGIQSKVVDNIFCFMCGSIINKDKMCCMGKKCCYTFDHCLNIITVPKIAFGIGFIK